MGRSVAVVIRKKEFGGEAPKEKSCSYSVIELAALIPYPPPHKTAPGPLAFSSLLCLLSSLLHCKTPPIVTKGPQ